MNKSKTYITTYCGQPLTLYELKNGKITYYTLNKVTGGVLNNIIVRKTSEKEIGEWRVINGSPLIYQDNDGNEYTEEEASDKISELEEQIEEAESQADDMQEEMGKDIPDCNLQETEDKINELEGKIEHWKGAIETLQDGEVREVYQYYIVSKSAFETWLKGTGELVLYNDELDMYVWCICFYGADWRDVLTDIPIPEQAAYAA